MTTATTCERCGAATLDGQACVCCPKCGGRKSATALQCYACAWPGREPRSTTRQPPPDMDAARPRSRTVVHFRMYCFACGRSTAVVTAPRHLNRCEACGGTMVVEMADD